MIYYALELNGVINEDFRYYDEEPDGIPMFINTFAITLPEHRGFRYLKLWDLHKGKGNSDSWS